MPSSLPHLVPGRNNEFGRALARTASLTYVQKLGQKPYGTLLHKSMVAERQFECTRRSALPPAIAIRGVGEFRHENAETLSSRTDPTKWVWGDLNRTRRPKALYINNMIKPRDRDAPPLAPVGDDRLGNRAALILQRWQSANDLVKAGRGRFGKVDVVRRENAGLANADMFTIMRGAEFTPSKRPEHLRPPVPTPRHFLW
ncbi:Uncharacterized protein PBTT_04813 [Plasmodiophora brassicae]